MKVKKRKHHHHHHHHGHQSRRRIHHHHRSHSACSSSSYISERSSSSSSNSRKRNRRSDDDSSSSSSSSSSSTITSISLKKKKLKKEREERKKQLKASETAEEKRARRLAKKELKDRKNKEALGWSKEYFGYTNENNPYGDGKLLEKFVWQKKIEKQGLTAADLKKERKNIEEAHLELEKLKKRRLEREREKEEREREREFLQRQKESDYYKEWAQQEDSFHLQQVKLRSRIRIQDGRAKPIDLLARYVDEYEDDTTTMHEPYTYLNGLSVRDLEDLLADISVYRKLEQAHHADYWRDIALLTEEELNKLKSNQTNRCSINAAVAPDMSQIFKGKAYSQLCAMEKKIREKISGDASKIDIGYWESILSMLQAHMARARLRDRHQELLRKKLEHLKQEQGLTCSKPLFSGVLNFETLKKQNDKAKSTNLDGNENLEEQSEDEERAIAEYESGNYSPVLLSPSELDIGSYVMEEEEEVEKLRLKRAQMLGTGSVRPDVEDAFEKKAREGMAFTGTSNFADEVPLQYQYLWSDKYRPRKPRFFNKVHTGYDWNQYNKKHYDTDNPPPKTVQGYKFNIFYPDLIDRTKAPVYDLKICEDCKDFAVLRFHAGPPYEDIAFKIVSKEWDYSYKHGFRCQFQNGIFQLWFHFRKWKYRR